MKIINSIESFLISGGVEQGFLKMEIHAQVSGDITPICMEHIAETMKNYIDNGYWFLTGGCNKYVNFEIIVKK